MVLQKLSWRETCPNHASIRLLTVARRGSCGPHKGADLAPRPVVGLVGHVGDVEKFPQAPRFESLDPFFRISKQGPCFTAIEEEGGGKRFVQFELACEADGVAPPVVAP